MTHPSGLMLRRLHAGEAVGDEPAKHVAACEACAATLNGFRDEQRAFEQHVPFESFASAVERKARPPARRWVSISMAIAAMLAVAFIAQFAMHPATETNRVKGGASVDFIVAGGGGQRQVAADPEALAPGERVRLGLTSGIWRYAMVASIDERGTITPIYLENGRSLSVNGTAWLPDSLEFTGQGLERVVVALSQAPITLDALSTAMKVSYDAAHGDLTHMADLELPGEQFQRTFLKP